jgi:hypothetical protein
MCKGLTEGFMLSSAAYNVTFAIHRSALSITYRVKRADVLV